MGRLASTQEFDQRLSERSESCCTSGLCVTLGQAEKVINQKLRDEASFKKVVVLWT